MSKAPAGDAPPPLLREGAGIVNVASDTALWARRA